MAERRVRLKITAITRRLKAILGFEIQIERLEGKFKLGQDEPKKDAIAVADHLDARGSAGDVAFAKKIREYNEARKDTNDSD